MKKLLLVLTAVSLPLAAGNLTWTARFDRADVSLTKDGAYDLVNINGYPALGNPGEPLLPSVMQSVVIPSGATPVSVELVAADWTVLPGTYYVGPAQPDAILPRPGHTDTPQLVPPDAEVYASPAPFPQSAVRLGSSGTMAGYRMAYVELRPVRWNPTSGRLELATRLAWRLTWTDGARAQVATAGQRDEFGATVKTLVVNKNDVEHFSPAVRRSTVSALPPGSYRYVVITETPMDTVFARLAAWKTQKGEDGTVVLVSWISTNYTGYDLQEKIRNFIKDAYATWGTQYVLLGGQGDYQSTGQNIVPTRMANCGDGDEPCDLYYAGLDGSWDANGNHVYGQIADQTDMCADVSIGRAPVYNVAMAQNFVAKVIKYEQDPPTGFIKKMMLPTGILWSSYEERPLQESLARMTPVGWSDGRLYERTGALSHQAVMDSFNAGAGMSHWDGHGNESGIYMNGGSTPFFVSSDADALVNGSKTGLAVSIACDCAAWDWVTNGDCLAEHMVNRVGGGFIATMMNTRYGYGAIGPGGGYVPGPSERLDTTMYAGAWEYNMPQIGKALGYSKATWSPYADSLYQFAKQRYCIYDLNLIGDPETPLWTAEPTAVNVSHTGVITIGNNIPYPVTVTAGFAPVESALVILRKAGEVNVRGRTGSSGQATLLVSALTPGPMVLTVNARDHLLYTDTVQVIASNRYVSHLRSWVLDPGPGGNNDSIMNPGETVNIPMWVKNWGQQTAMTVSAKLRTHDPNAQVTDSARTFGNIAAGDSSFTGAPGFGLHVNTGLANGYAVACSLVCRDANDSVWVSLLSYQVGAPILEKRGVTVADTAHSGNGNGRLDPNETADLWVRLANTGLGHGYNVRATLRSADARLTVSDSTAAWSTIRKGDSAFALDRFTVYAQAGIPPETPLACTLAVTADGGYSAKRGFTVIVGEFRNIDPIPDGPRLPALYYAYDDKDTGYARHPQYSWVEIKSQGTRLSFSNNDAVIVVTLPSGFGPVKYYGQRYTQVSVSADGWIVPGSYTTTNYSNTALPSTGAPPRAICANWDDLYPGYSSAGYAYWYHDAANHRFVVEFDSASYYSPTSLKDKFEFIFYDTTLAATDGNTRFQVQYMTANGLTASTVGMQDGTQQIGIQCLLNGGYHKGCAPLAAQRAILYTTDPPGQVGLEADPADLLVAARGLALWPNPSRGRALVSWNLAAAGKVDLSVFDAAGRQVSSLVNAELAPGRHTRTWDNRQLAPGVYFLKLSTPDGTKQQKVILTD